MKRSMSLAAAVLIAVSLAVMINNTAVVVDAEGGLFRTRIDINVTAGALPATIKLTLDSTWDGWRWVSLDGSDIYFTDSDGNPLYYYIGGIDLVHEEAVIWVNATTPTIYMYYGGDNPYSSYNDYSHVFMFYDDFDSGMDNWVVDSDIVYTVSNSELVITGCGAYWNTMHGMRALFTPPDDGFRVDIEGYYYDSSDTSDIFHVIVMLSNGTYDRPISVGVKDSWGSSYGSVYAAVSDATTYTYYLPGPGTETPPTRHDFTIIKTGGIVTIYVDGKPVIEKASDIDISELWIVVNRYSTYGFGTVKIDAVRVYSYANYTYSVSESEYMGSAEYSGGYVTENVKVMLLPGYMNTVLYDNGITVRYEPLVNTYFNAFTSTDYINPGRTLLGIAVYNESAGYIAYSGGYPQWIFIRMSTGDRYGVYDEDVDFSLTTSYHEHVENGLVTAIIGHVDPISGAYSYVYGGSITYTSITYLYVNVESDYGYIAVENTNHEKSEVTNNFAYGLAGTNYVKGSAIHWILINSDPGKERDPDLESFVAVTVYVRFAALNIVNATIIFDDGASISVVNPGEIVKYNIAGYPSRIEAVLSITYRPASAAEQEPAPPASRSTILSIDFMPLLFYLLAMIVPVSRWLRDYVAYYALFIGFIYASVFNLTVFYVPLIIALFALAYRIVPFQEELKIILGVAAVYMLSGAIVFDTYRSVVPPGNPLDWGNWFVDLVSFSYLPSPFSMLFTVVFLSMLSFAVIRLTIRVVRGA